MKPKHDVKFIIYQSLYIFVICIIAMKGADINLDAVEIKKMIEPGYVYIDTSGKVLIDRDRASKLIEFDSTRFMIVSIDEYNKDPEKFVGSIINNPGSIGSNPPPIVQNPPQTPDVNKVENPGSGPIQYVFPSNYVQYRQNSIQNTNNVEIKVSTLTGTVIIPPNSKKSVTLMGDNTITLTAGGDTKSFNVKENKKPSINFQRTTTMGEDARASNLQRNICYRITINDDYTDQLEVKINGPVTYKQVSGNIYDVTMNAFSSRSAFDNFTNNIDSPYSVGFTVSVSDNIAGHKITGQNSFIFGEW